MASVKLLLNKSRRSKSGLYPLVFQIIHQRRKKLIYTHFKVVESAFDPQQEKVCATTGSGLSNRDVRTMNRKIGTQRKNIRWHIEELARRYGDYTVADIQFRYKTEHDSLSLLRYMDIQISRKRDSGREGTACAYCSTRSSVASFVGHRKVNIDSVDISFIQEYERFLLHKGVCDNTVGFYMRNLRSMYNQAAIDGYHKGAENPFQSIVSKPRKTIKRALKRDLVRHLAELDLSDKPHRELARDIFLFSFFTRGMSFVDVLHLKHSDMPGGVISYRRHKTLQWLHISVTPQLRSIIEKYRSSSSYVFPILNPDSDKPLYKQYRQALERTNRNLKEVAKEADVEASLTTYMARHSWATQAKDGGAPIAVISEGLGHTTEKTTQVYLKEFDQSVVDQVNEQVSAL